MNKIALIGAFDRDNYGDIFMPIVFENYMKKNHYNYYSNISFCYYGLKESNMDGLKGRNTKSLSSLREDIDNIQSIILVGGAILSCRYGDMFIHLQKDNSLIILYKFCDLFFRPIFDIYCKNKLRAKNIQPWLIDEFSNKTIIYNTVSGLLTNRKLFLHKKKILNALKNSSYISVRDNKTKYYLDKNNIKNYLYPDSVLLLSKVIDEEEIILNVSKEKIEVAKKFDKYIVIQMNAKIGFAIIEKLKPQIEKLYHEFNISCVLLPIGRAPGHEDHLPLQKLADMLSTPHYIPPENNIYETLFLIKNSSMYCGTSLHGTITAISYCIPHVALTSLVPKLNNFINTWDTTPYKNVEAEELFDCYKYLKTYKDLDLFMTQKRDELQSLVIENFERIHEIIKKSE